MNNFKSIIINIGDIVMLVYEALSGWGSGKVLLDFIFKIQENLLIMISNTIQILFIVYINTFLQKKCVLPHVRNFTLNCGPFQLPNYYPCQHNFYGKFCCLFKCSLNFRAHALQLELKKVLYTNFVQFQLQSMSSKIERAFEKTTKYVFVFILPTSSLP